MGGGHPAVELPLTRPQWRGIQRTPEVDLVDNDLRQTQQQHAPELVVGVVESHGTGLEVARLASHHRVAVMSDEVESDVSFHELVLTELAYLKHEEETTTNTTNDSMVGEENRVGSSGRPGHSTIEDSDD